MNRVKILEMKPGEELDAMVAESVMDRPNRKPRHGSCCTCQRCGWDYDNCQCNYSQFLEDAWKVVDKILSKGGEISLHSSAFKGGRIWVAEFIPIFGWCNAYGDTAPEAICKAALLAMLHDA